MPSPRTALREELTARLLPGLLARGFTGPGKIMGNALMHEFRRPAGEATHVLTLQLEKRGLPRFMLTLAIESAGGFEALTRRGGSVRQGQVLALPGTTTRSWFRADPTLLQQWLGRKAYRYADAVDACLAVLPEIDAWWAAQAPSAHIRVHTVQFPGGR